MPFNFQLISADWNASAIAQIVDDYEAALLQGDWPNWVLGNHDQRRIASRVGLSAAPLAAMLLLTLRGTPTLYYGDELGLEDVTIPPDRTQDPWAKNEPGHGFGRDPQRTPMPWDGSAQAGFSEAVPWLPLNADFTTRNVMALQADPASILHFYRRMIALRRANPALSIGHFVSRGALNDVYCFERYDGNARVLVALNFSGDPRPLPGLPNLGMARVMLSTRLDRFQTRSWGLKPYAQGDGGCRPCGCSRQPEPGKITAFMINDLWYKNADHLLPVGRQFHGCQRRRDRRLPRPHAALVLPSRTGGDRALVDAVPHVAIPR